MPKVAPIDRRKSEHIRINLENDVKSKLTTGLEKYQFVHQPLPEINLENIDTKINVFGKRLSAPILISSMTGGTPDAAKINERLARAAQDFGVALGVGSQRAALEESKHDSSFTITRKVAPEILLFANLGAVQLNYGFTVDHCRRAVDMISADALFLHLNPLQEALQDAGNTNWVGIAHKIEDVCKNLEVPVIAKEVGWGISEKSASLLAECGVAAIDVAGAGGTSWSQVEMYRAPNEFARTLASTFAGWGITTSTSILNIRKAVPDMMIFASGGLQDGLDMAKCISLGSTLCGMAGPFLKTASISTEKVLEMLKLTKRQIEIAMFAAGASDLVSLKNTELMQIQ